MDRVDRYLRGYNADCPLEYAEMTICREFGWTFDELDAQPSWRIEQMFRFLQREAVYQKTQQS